MEEGETNVAPLDVVKAFLALQELDLDSGDVITNLKAQKLVYYAQGWHLAKFDSPLFQEDFQAWAHGPVIPELYNQLKKFGSRQIGTIGDLDPDIFSRQQLDLLISVYKTYAQYSAWKLRDMTHGETPWRNTKQSDTITKDSIKSFFSTAIA